MYIKIKNFTKPLRQKLECYFYNTNIYHIISRDF